MRDGLNYPSNSHKDREIKKDIEAGTKDNKKVSKVISGRATTRKKSWGKRFMENFLGDDVENVGFYIIHDVLIPAAKNTLSDMVQGGIEMLLFPGGKRDSRTRRENGRSYISYDKYSSNNRRDDTRDISRKNRARHNFEEIVLDSRGEAEEVLSLLVDLIDRYDQATVADLYDLVGIKGEYTDRNYGWENLRSGSVDRVRGGYLLNLPKPILLD